MRGEGTGLGPEEFRPRYHPSGFDGPLRSVLEDLRAGRWLSMRELLAGTGDDWELRTARTQVLGAVAAGSDVVETWLTEQPESAEARLMHARVAVERAERARRVNHREAAPLEAEAREACLTAAGITPEDPVPWVCLLALSPLDPRQVRAEHQQPPPEPMLPYGPWGLLQRVRERDRYNREAFHRVLHFLHVRSGGSPAEGIDFARWVASWAPGGSALLVVPLYAQVEHLRRQRAQGLKVPLSRPRWSGDPAVWDAERALEKWFTRAPPERRSLLDLNYLAHALWAAVRFREAARVFEALGPYATRLPWAYLTDDADQPELAVRQFVRARAHVLYYAGESP
ncbi:hypothetical protein [Streptomyces boncukensis]|uniref:DUF4034 domain-containing protein n=1 Tax=Streptomyces boncukensis TaxID=2711219 RepID=A0A6G4X0V9_9ACTN|nr:hypothetical protein [Streptomyces boncukensis]NGO70301.1 hypothetical protein [Streptomyces boncukensis]